MNRIEAFHTLAYHAFYKNQFKKLRAEGVEDCENFIKENDQLDKNGFAHKANRWGLDLDKSRKSAVLRALKIELIVVANQISTKA